MNSPCWHERVRMLHPSKVELLSREKGRAALQGGPALPWGGAGKGGKTRVLFVAAKIDCLSQGGGATEERRKTLLRVHGGDVIHRAFIFSQGGEPYREGGEKGGPPSLRRGKRESLSSRS